MILAGLWFANEKPPMQTFLKPICTMLLELESEGMYQLLTIKCSIRITHIYMYMQDATLPHGKYTCTYLHVGVIVHVPEKDPFRITAHVICCCVDLPAKALVLNCIQYNGAYGCGYCEQPGESTRTSGGGTVRTFPYEVHNKKSELRTALSVYKYALEATETQSAVSNVFCKPIIMCVL